MTSPPRFLFDECLSKPSMLELQGLVAPQLEFKHITDIFVQGVLDSVWVPRIANDGRWIVITADRAKRGSRKGGKLPRLCLEYKLTHVLLSGSLHEKSTAIKRDAIRDKWSSILQLDRVPPGSRYKLLYRPVKGTTTETRLCFERCRT